MTTKKYYLPILATLLLLIISCSSLKNLNQGILQLQQKRKRFKNGINPYDKVITKEAVTDSGLFAVHTVNDDYFYEIPDSLFNRDMLMVTRIAKTAAEIGFGGGKTNTQVLRWEKGPKSPFANRFL